MDDASLDDFLDSSTDGDDDEGATTDESERDADATTTSAAPADAEETDAAAVDADEAAADTVDPATTTYQWTPTGATCAACGEQTERRWHSDDGLVCPDCKEW
jgi:NADH pyrophosphatase NudC (nudix superfamily)